jgi:colanic acid biosynthesis glycosyl transferase WcaI
LPDLAAEIGHRAVSAQSWAQHLPGLVAGTARWTPQPDMHLLILSQYFSPETGAAPVRLLAFARELRCLGHEVEVVTAMPNYPGGQILPAYRGRLRLTETCEGLSLHRVWLWAAKGAGVGRLLNYFSFMGTALLPLLKVGRPDVIFVESPPMTLFLTGLAYRLRFPRALLVYNIADQWIEAMRDFGVIANPRILAGLGRCVRFCYDRADLITTVTRGIVDDLIGHQGLPADKVLLLPNGADPATPGDEAVAEELLAKLGLTDRRLALCIGTHGYIHGMDTLLDAAAALTDLPDLVVLLIGDGSEKARLIELARARRLANVRFADPVPAAAVLPLYRRAAVALSTLRDLPIARAARPVRALSAIAAGVPIVYAGAGEGAELVRAAGAGIVTPPGDGQAIAAAVRKLLADPAAARAMGESGRVYMATNLTWPAIVRGFQDELVRRLEARRTR